MTHMSLRTVTIDLGNLRGQIFSRTEFAPSAEVVVRLTCQKRGGTHCHYGDRPPGTADRSYACSTAIGLCVLHEGSAIPLFPNAINDVRRQPAQTLNQLAYC